MKECVVVLGMHRSGTSVLSGLVSLQGFHIGISEMPPRQDNPKGFFENFEIYRLNQKILEDHDVSWDSYSFTFDEITPKRLREYKRRAKEIIKNEFGITKRIFIKDPRMCLLFPLWESVLKQLNFNIKVVYVYRSPVEVALSLEKRNKFALEKSLLIWSHYCFQAEKLSRSSKRIYVHFSEDLQEMELFINKLSSFLGINYSLNLLDAALSFYTPSLTHHKLDLENISDEIPTYLKDFITLLKGGKLNQAKRIDKIVNDFYYSQDLYLFENEKLINKLSTLEDELSSKQEDLKLFKKIYEDNKTSYESEIDKLKTENRNLKKENIDLETSVVELREKSEKETDFLKNELDTVQKQLDSTSSKLSKSNAKLNEIQSELNQRNVQLSETLTSLARVTNSLEVAEDIAETILESRRWRKRLSKYNKESNYFKIKRKMALIKSKNKRAYIDDRLLIVDSGYFSPLYYLIQNPDVWLAKADPLNHFCNFGWKEGRDPSPNFSCSDYLSLNKDVELSGKNPLLHYLRYGKGEGRSLRFNSSSSVNKTYQSNELNVLAENDCSELRKEYQNIAYPELLLKDDEHGILVSIIVLNRDGLEHLKILIPSLYASTKGINYELIVVDNGSSDGSIEYLENIDIDINLKVIKNNSNETFSKANNSAAKHAGGRYLVLLNNDVEPLTGWLHWLLFIVKTKEKIGSVGSRLIYPFKDSFKNSCRVQHSGIAFRDEVSFIRPYNQGNGQLRNSPVVNENGEKGALTAACLLIPIQLYQEVGGLDEGYNYGFEDVDLGLKLHQAGYTNYYCSESVLFHYEFGTQNKNNRADVIKRRENNTKLFREKWFSSIRKSYWREKLYVQSHLFADSPLKVAIAVTDYGPKVTAGDYFTAQEIASHLEVFGWNIQYLSRIKEEWYQIDDDIDVVISLLDAYDLTKLPKRIKRLTTIAWARNWFDRWCDMPCFNDYDMVFASSNKSCEYIRQHSSQEPVLLPIASNTERFSQEVACKNADYFKSDICFTGSYWNSPREIMSALSEDALSKYQFNVYGANWENFEKFKSHDKGFVSYEDMPNVYRHTKIVIDDANHVTKPYGAVNSRVFDAILSNALVITNGVEGSKDLFDGELPFYETSKELDELLDFYLNNEKARLDKIKQLKRLVLSSHTYQHRADAIRDALVKRFLSKSIAIKIPCPTWEGAYSWGDYHMAVLLKKQFEELGYHVLLQILPEWDNKEGMECDVALILRGLSRYNPKSHQINLMWNISHPDKVTLEEYEEYDKVFIASDLWANKIAKQISVPVETMLQCTDPKRFHKPSDQENLEYKQQLLFIGNSRDIYRKVLKDLIPTKYDLAVYGKNWKKLIPKKYIKADYISNDELYKYYASADILLNDHWDDMREQGFVSNRIFDGLACGAFILTDKVEAMGELSDFVQTYETKEELQEHVEYYLNHLDERIERAQKGMQYVIENHTFKERAVQFAMEIDLLSEDKPQTQLEKS